MSAALRHLFPVQVRGRESNSCLGHNYSLRQDCNHLWWLALVEVLPSAHGGRSWHVGMVPALSSVCAPLQWCISFQADLASSRGFLAMHLHPPVTSAVSTQPTVFFSLDQFSQPRALALSPCQYQWILFSGSAHD